MSSNPSHIAIILDGNRRWARKKKMQPWKGHEEGLRKVQGLIEWAQELGIRELTLYSFSTENFNRERKEIDFLMDIFFRAFEKLTKSTDLKKKDVRVRAVGRLWMFPPKVQKAMQKAMDLTKECRGLTVNFALAYGGRQEIVDAVKHIAEGVKYGNINPKDITEEVITKSLYVQSEPQIIIRPGGEKRVSNFLIWQGIYSEWFFLDKLWPQFTKNDLKKVIAQYKERQRRFGA